MTETRYWRPKLTLMDRGEVEELHGAATAILEETGLNVHHQEMRGQLADAGAKLGEGHRVYLPADMVAQALATARREVHIYDRAGELGMRLGAGRIHFGTGSDLMWTNDVTSGERRSSTLEDVARAARLCDALGEIDFVMSFALPADAGEGTECQQYLALLSNTVKPAIMTSFSGLDTLARMHEMACLVAGGDDAFRKHPNYIMYGQFVSPLQHDQLAIERLVFCADHEVPLIYIPTIMPGASGPMTLSGSVALAAAESLAGLVMHQTRHPGAPFIFGACVSQLDMRTMLFPYGSPEWRLSDLAIAELARFYGLPVFGTGGATDSKVVDAQAGAEYASSLLVAALSGADLIHDVGYLDSGLAGSLESIIMGAEQIRWIKQFIGGLEVSEETLARQSIADVGPGGNFLGHDHTLQHLRRTMWEPYVSDRAAYDTWVGAGARDYAARARDFARELVASHRPAAMDAALAAELARV